MLIPNKESGLIKKLSIDGNSMVEPFNYKFLSKTKEGITKPQYIQFGNYNAFMKDSRATDDSDDMEMVINWIGRKLDIKMAETYRFFSENNKPTALISVNVASSPGETFFSMEKVREQVIASVKDGKMSYEPWMKRYAELLEQKAYPSIAEAFENIVYDEVETREILEFGEKLIEVVSTLQTDKALLKKDYHKMIFLDAFVGQVDRTLGNYGLVYNAFRNEYSFAPLFDNATLRKPYTGYGICLINGFIAERISVFEILLEDKEILSMVESVIENKFEFISALLKVASEWLKLNQYDLLISNILTGIFALEKLIANKRNDK